jgi:UDP-GlcNAc:undecaprenyl-phosphate/decaprenyl-phosphate GlcNAc-1-phosphate transferase
VRIDPPRAAHVSGVRRGKWYGASRMIELLWMAGKAFIIALILTPIIRDISRSFNIVDRPGHRKVHAYPMPRVGGIAIAIAYCATLILFRGADSTNALALHPVWRIIPGAALVFFIGLLDDFLSLKPVVKILGLVIAASIVYFSGIHVGGIAEHSMVAWLDYPLTVFWLLLTSNALNLVDGLDGLCAGMGLVATLALFTAAMIHGNHPLAYVTFPLAGALLGFLCYNVAPATVFLGDSGALLIGFLLGCYGMLWSQKTSTLLSMLVPLLALSIPLLDVSLSVLRRFLRNQPIFSADRGHIHHRLIDRGLSPRQAVWVLYLFAALAASLALLASSFGWEYQGFVILAFAVVAWVGIRKLRYPEFDLAGRLLFRGEFQRAMNVRLKIESVASSLERAATSDQWWDTLVQSLGPLGLIAIRWTSAAGVREQRRGTPAPSAWSFRVPLAASDSIEFEGGFAPDGALAGPAFDLIGFAEILNRTFPPNRAVCAPGATAESVAAALP